jgi:hypothetical protein
LARRSPNLQAEQTPSTMLASNGGRAQIGDVLTLPEIVARELRIRVSVSQHFVGADSAKKQLSFS